MAEVFLARRPGPDGAGFEKRVAIKRILPHLAKQADFVAMFLDEARLAATLDHPHIVHIHDFGVDGGAYYLAMEYVCGEDVQALMRKSADDKMALPFVDVATLLVAAAEALHHAHERGVVHRDVTPANLIVSYDGVVKLADFGIAKSQAVASRAQTNAGTLKGKIPYMSPEQARARPLDRRSDLFSLGVVAWELLTGKRLFHRRNELDMLRAVQMCDVPPLASVRPDVPPALAAAVETALAADPDERWATAAELAGALSAWLASAGETSPKVHLSETMARLFGADAAERRLAAVSTPSEATAANLMLPPDEPSDPHRFSPLRPERWIPQIAMHLHLPPPRLPPLRLLGPALALLLSGGGLLFGLHSPHAHWALSAGLGLPTSAAPVTAPALLATPRTGTAPTLVPRALHIDTPPPGLTPAPLLGASPPTLTTPSLAPPRVAAPPRAAASKTGRDMRRLPRDKSQRHDRQRRRHAAGV